MKRFGIVPVLVLIALMLTFCGREYPYQFKAKFTLTIDTPRGVKTASSVVYLKVIYPDPTFEFMRLPEASGLESIFEGEAISLELGTNRYLFVLLPEEFVNKASRTLNHRDLGRQYSDDRILVKKIQEKIDAVKATGAVQDVPREVYPYFVIFDNIKNPDKLIKVDPLHLSYTFGFGYKLRSLTMTYTDEPVTTGKVIAAVGEGFFERWEKRMLSDIDGVEWKKQKKEFRNIVYREAFISGDK